MKSSAKLKSFNEEEIDVVFKKFYSVMRVNETLLQMLESVSTVFLQHFKISID